MRNKSMASPKKSLSHNPNNLSENSKKNEAAIKFTWMFALYTLVMIILFLSFIKTSYASGSGCGSSCGSCGCGDDEYSRDSDHDGSEDSGDSENNDGNQAEDCTDSVTLNFQNSNDYTQVSYSIESCSVTTFNLYMVRDPADGRADRYILRDRAISPTTKISGSGKEYASSNYIQICFESPAMTTCCTSGGSITC